MAGDVGAIVVGLGLTGKEAGALSSDLVKLAVDVSSFANVSQEQAINAITSGLVGERESLKTLGVVIQEAAVGVAVEAAAGAAADAPRCVILSILVRPPQRARLFCSRSWGCYFGTAASAGPNGVSLVGIR